MPEFLQNLITEWWGITLLCVLCVAVWLTLSTFLYRRFFKRFYDILLGFTATVVLSPVLLLLTLVGAFAMHGNPFFAQKRPGRRKKLSRSKCLALGVPYGTYGEEKIIRLLKFRTMTNKKDADGNLLPDEERLNKYGKFLRSTSLDELPSLLNIVMGDISIVGPRPLLVKYLPLYSAEQRHRHDVRPGLTGLAQVMGRNGLSWEDKFKYDLEYVNNITLWCDIKIIFQTVGKVFMRSGISQAGQATMEEFLGNEESGSEKPLISVIVPVYNIERYIGECIESIVNQTYSHLQIILVDDGSTDNSGNICDAYAAKDARINVIHKENGGLVSARKTGLNEATGKYVGYIDGDDKVGADFYSRLAAAAEANESDLVAAGYTREFIGKTEIMLNNIEAGYYSGDRLESMSERFISVGEIYVPGLFTYVWNKLFKRDVLTAFQHAVPNEVTVGEDAAVLFPLLGACKLITVIDDASYIYRQHEQSMIKKTDWSERKNTDLQVLVGFLPNSVNDRYRDKVKDFLLNLLLIHSGSRIGEQFIFDRDLRGKDLVLYSGGTFGQYIMKGAKVCGLEFSAWVDDDYEECRACGLDVDPIDTVKSVGFDYILIASTSSVQSQKIKGMLTSMNIAEQKIIMYTFSQWEKRELLAKYSQYYGVEL